LVVVGRPERGRCFGFFGSKGDAVHGVAVGAEEECVLYVRSNGNYEVHRE